jgi:hypothetical protein
LPSAPSRFEVEHLYRLMLKASAEAARLEDQVVVARSDDSLWPALRHWCEAADALDEAVARGAPELLRDGTPNEQIERVRSRLREIRQRSRSFDLDFHLDPCVEAWSSLALELGQLSGRQRDPLLRLFERRKPLIEQARAMLVEAQRQEGLLAQAHRKLLHAEHERDRAREKAERLKQAWLTAQRDREAAERERTAAEQRAAEERAEEERAAHQRADQPTVVQPPVDQPTVEQPRIPPRSPQDQTPDDEPRRES